MKVEEIMNRTPVTVRFDQTFGDAFQTLAESRQTILPAVDADGTYRGLFDLKDIWKILLPKAAQLSRKSIEDLAFEAKALPVSQFLNKDDAPPLHPDSPVIQAVLFLDEYGETIAVVDRQTKKLVGVVSAWQLLDAIR